MEAKREPCTECGAIIDASDAFCRHCGATRAANKVSRKTKASRRPANKKKWAPAGARAIHEIAGATVDEVVGVLKSSPHSIKEFQKRQLAGPGVYAIYGTSDAWRELGLGDPPDDRPLYVGKHETDAAKRILREHFAVGYTNPRRPVTSISSFRRSLAGLLRDGRQFRGVPRYPDKDKPTTQDMNGFGLATPEQEKELTSWMQSQLTATAWIPESTVLKSLPKTETVRIVEPLERQLKLIFLSPCNVDGGDPITPWTETVEDGRRAMRGDAKEWVDRRSST